MRVLQKIEIRTDPETGYGEVTKDELTFTTEGTVIFGGSYILFDGEGIEYADDYTTVYREPSVGAELVITSLESNLRRCFVFEGFEWYQVFDDAPFVIPEPPDVIDRVGDFLDIRVLPVMYMAFVVFAFAAFILGVIYALSSI